MERIKRKDGQVLYRKIGGGSFRLKNKRIIKPGQTFYAFPDDVKNFFSWLECLEEGIKIKPKPKDNPEVEEKEVKMKEEIKKHIYTKKHKGAGWYNIFDSNGKQMNEKLMRKDEADKILIQLQEV